jgi:hypothetical protein
MRAMTLKLLRIPFARDTNHEPEISIRAGLYPGNGILDDDRPGWLDPKKFCSHQERIRRRLAGESFRLDGVAIHPHLEEVVQLGGFQDMRAVLTRGHDGNLESVAADLTNEAHGSVVRLNPYAFDKIVDQIVLTVPQPAHGFEVRRIVRTSLRELDTA